MSKEYAWLTHQFFILRHIRLSRKYEDAINEGPTIALHYGKMIILRCNYLFPLAKQEKLDLFDADTTKNLILLSDMYV